MAKGIVIVIVVVVVFIIVAISLWVLYDYKNNSKKVTCSSQNCPSGQFCNSSGVCTSGTGGTTGSQCADNDTCNYGLVCLNGACAAPPTPIPIVPPTPPTIPQFMLRWTARDGQLFYLIFNSSQAGVFSSSPPTDFRFSFDINQPDVITFVAPNAQSPYSNAALATSLDGYFFPIQGTPTKYTLNFSSDYSTLHISDPCGNLLSICLDIINGTLMLAPVFLMNSSQCPGCEENTQCFLCGSNNPTFDVIKSNL